MAKQCGAVDVVVVVIRLRAQHDVFVFGQYSRIIARRFGIFGKHDI